MKSINDNNRREDAKDVMVDSLFAIATTYLDSDCSCKQWSNHLNHQRTNARTFCLWTSLDVLFMDCFLAAVALHFFQMTTSIYSEIRNSFLGIFITFPL